MKWYASEVGNTGCKCLGTGSFSNKLGTVPTAEAGTQVVSVGFQRLRTRNFSEWDPRFQGCGNMSSNLWEPTFLRNASPASLRPMTLNKAFFYAKFSCWSSQQIIFQMHCNCAHGGKQSDSFHNLSSCCSRKHLYCKRMLISA